MTARFEHEVDTSYCARTGSGRSPTTRRAGLPTREQAAPSRGRRPDAQTDPGIAGSPGSWKVPASRSAAEHRTDVVGRGSPSPLAGMYMIRPAYCTSRPRNDTGPGGRGVERRAVEALADEVAPGGDDEQRRRAPASGTSRSLAAARARAPSRTLEARPGRALDRRAGSRGRRRGPCAGSAPGGDGHVRREPPVGVVDDLLACGPPAVSARWMPRSRLNRAQVDLLLQTGTRVWWTTRTGRGASPPLERLGSKAARCRTAELEADQVVQAVTSVRRRRQPQP